MVELRMKTIKKKMLGKHGDMKASERDFLRGELSKYDGVLITGASSGIGRGFVEVLDDIVHLRLCNMSRSFPSYLSDRKDFLHVPCNLENSGEISAAVPAVLEFFGYAESSKTFVPRILLINNSGFGAYGEFPEPSADRNCAMVDVNVRAVVQLCAAFYGTICEGRGAIINVASTAAFQPCPHLAVYAATKSFVKSFTLGISYELRKRGCKCLCVCPGPTSSNFFKAAGFESPPLPGNFGHKPRDVARSAFDALARSEILCVVGALNRIQTFAVRFLPEAVLTGLAGRILLKIRSRK